MQSDAKNKSASDSFISSLQESLAPSPREELHKVSRVPMKVSAVLGTSNIKIGDLINMNAGSIVELDKKVGQAIDIFVNDQLAARGEVVIIEGKLGVSITEIIKATT